MLKVVKLRDYFSLFAMSKLLKGLSGFFMSISSDVPNWGVVDKTKHEMDINYL